MKRKKRDSININTQQVSIKTSIEMLADLDTRAADIAAERAQIQAMINAENEKEIEKKAEDDHRARCFWPEGKKIPTEFLKIKRESLPCPNCRRIVLDSGAQAAVCMSSRDDLAYFRCKECGHRWKMAVKNT